MNCISLNISGIGDAMKVNWVRQLKHLHKVNFIGIQETQLLEFKKIDLQGFWGNQEFDYDGVNSTGRSGCLVSIWNNRCFKKKRVINSRHYLIIFDD